MEFFDPKWHQVFAQDGRIEKGIVNITLEGNIQPQWRDITLEGYVDDAFLYATVLSKHLMPFRVEKFHLVALPVKVDAPQQAPDAPGESVELRFIRFSKD